MFIYVVQSQRLVKAGNVLLTWPPGVGDLFSLLILVSLFHVCFSVLEFLCSFL